ncbi:copper-translocating P-type ATPase [Enterococcus alcedinis]|uniref:P-type Cu(+) transporter n=2 Tax=Enterococcus alcedinis TaxID=1274384 RepID=A0A917JH75_9ENTE|nr:Cu2+-exporting ATPase [Enterococcus alcedinis]GGI66736.1 copper-translocating P-type ATPase [Enterococcus alcedinis]
MKKDHNHNHMPNQDHLVDERHQAMSHEHHSHEGMDHSQHHGAHEEMDHSMHHGNFKQKFWLSLALAIPILFISPMMGVDLPFQFQFPGSEWLVLILATILFIYGGQPFLSGAKMELKDKNPAMMTLISMGITVAYLYSLYAFVINTFTHQHVMDFFWELASLIVIMLLGHWIEMNAVANAGDALKKLAELLPDEVIRIKQNGEQETVSLQMVHEGDVLVVRAGDKMPTDGVIEKGTSIVDEAAVTGESRGVVKQVDDRVIGGSVNGDGTLQIRVTGTGESGYLAKVMEMVRKAQAEKSKLEALSDKVAKGLFYIALAVGLIAFIVWLILGDLPLALERMVTVFIIACPHALGLAIPLVVARSTSIAAKNGLLLKNRMALENGHHVDKVLLDKTGTLTEGSFSVTGVDVIDTNYSIEEILKYIGALEVSANHPIAKGIMNYIKEQNVSFYEATDEMNITGVGLQGIVNNQQVKIVNGKELARLGLDVSKETIQKYQEQGNTISYLLIEEKIIGLIALGDQVKPEAKAFISSLKERGIEPVMLTGDNKEAAENVARYLGITNFQGGLLPEDKEAIVADFTRQGQRIVMVGDGINDAPSLARATVGVAIGAGTDVALDSADVVLTNSNPEDILRFLDLAKQTRRKMVQNLWWGAGYNLLAIPLAAGILAPIGIVLSPAVGAVLMSLSTIIVALNAMTLTIKK